MYYVYGGVENREGLISIGWMKDVLKDLRLVLFVKRRLANRNTMKDEQRHEVIQNSSMTKFYAKFHGVILKYKK